jgi:hypothetical protein
VPAFSTLRRPIYCLAVMSVFAVSLAAQEAAPSPEAVPISMEGHHHLVFENSYVHVLFVEIPSHETTLRHRHDLPYISLPLPASDTAPSAQRVLWSPGHMSHAVTNSGENPMRIVAIELVRPQESVRNRCAAILRDQPKENCEENALSAINPWKHTPLFETDEILVESWELGPNATTPALDDRFDMLLGALSDVSVTGDSGLDSANAVRGGSLWVPAGSKPVFKTSPDRGGHFTAIIFKDSGVATR